ncbi:MAG: response regulator [Bacillota bacterium]|jgi:two-component system response regulator (stage 0 sporulation protein F)
MDLGDKSSILIVDDQLGVRQLLYEALKDDYQNVFLAGSGVEAITKVEEHKPDLVIMDMKMPRMNGIEVMENMSKMGYRCPVIMMTAYGELEVISQATQMGIKSYITKPFDLKELKQLIKDTLNDEKER